MERIIEIIKEIRPAANIDENTKLIEEKIIDSLAMIMLVAELNDEFDIEISAMDIVPENFATVKDIFAFVERIQDED